MAKEKILIHRGDRPEVEELEVEVAPLTFVAKHPSHQDRIEYPNRVEIDPEQTLFHAEKVRVLHDDFEECWKIVWNGTCHGEDVQPPCEGDPVAIRNYDTACMHLMGLIDLSLKFRDMGVPFMWKYPETYLHPALQASLADFAVKLIKPDVEEEEEEEEDG